MIWLGEIRLIHQGFSPIPRSLRACMTLMGRCLRYVFMAYKQMAAAACNLFCRTGSTNGVCITMSNKTMVWNGCLENSGNSDATAYVVLQETQCQPGFSNYAISEVHVKKSDLIFPIPPTVQLDAKKKKNIGKVGQWLDYSSISACCHYSELSITAEVGGNAEPPPSELTPSSVPTSSSPHWGHGQHPGVWLLCPERWLGLCPAGALCSEKRRQRRLCCMWHVWWTLWHQICCLKLYFQNGDSTSAEVME